MAWRSVMKQFSVLFPVREIERWNGDRSISRPGDSTENYFMTDRHASDQSNLYYEHVTRLDQSQSLNFTKYIIIPFILICCYDSARVTFTFCTLLLLLAHSFKVLVWCRNNLRSFESTLWVMKTGFYSTSISLSVQKLWEFECQNRKTTTLKNAQAY